MHPLYEAALAADTAWHNALKAAFGKRAGDVRYTKAGVGAPELAALHATWRHAMDEWLAFMKQ